METETVRPPEQTGEASHDPLLQLGILDYRALARAVGVQGRTSWIVDGLIRPRSVNLLVGFSGLGKTPLTVSLGVALASGRPFLGRPVTQTSVLYCDAEMGNEEFDIQLRAISQATGLAQPPDDFRVWDPYWDAPEISSLSDQIHARVRAMKPGLVIIDPLRAFFPDAERQADEAAKLITSLRKLGAETGAAFVLNHHRRKTKHDNPVSLQDDRHTWFEEAAGSAALVNGTDTRLGVEASSGPADLLLAGFVRGRGWTGSLHLERTCDAEGDPLGYRLVNGVDLMTDSYKNAFASLPDRFRFTDAKNALGGRSDSNTKEFCQQCQAAGIVRREGRDYVKVAPESGVAGA